MQQSWKPLEPELRIMKLELKHCTQQLERAMLLSAQLRPEYAEDLEAAKLKIEMVLARIVAPGIDR